MPNGTEPSYQHAVIAALKKENERLQITNRQLGVALKTVSTLAAHFKGMLHQIVNIADNLVPDDSVFKPRVQQAQALLAKPTEQFADEMFKSEQQCAALRALVQQHENHRESLVQRINNLETELKQLKQ